MVKQFPIVESDRLILRKIEVSDANSILFLRSNKAVNQYIDRPEDRKTKTLSDAVKFIQGLDVWFTEQLSITWGITLKNDSSIIGTICLWNYSEDMKTAEVGYDLNPEFQGKGIMSEALGLVINYGFNDLKLDKIEAFTDVNNQPSKKLLEKNGFHLIKERIDIENKANRIYVLKK